MLKGGDGYDDQEGGQEILHNLQMQSILLKFVSGSLSRKEGAPFLAEYKANQTEWAWNLFELSRGGA